MTLCSRRAGASLVSLILAIAGVRSIAAHENDHTHPTLTAAALRLLAEQGDAYFTAPDCIAIVEGSIEEDDGDYQVGSNEVSRPCFHFYNPVTKANAIAELGLGEWGCKSSDPQTAPQQAQRHWKSAIAKFPNDRLEALRLLGRALHLLQDMTSPAHVHGDAHAGYLLWTDVCDPASGLLGDADDFENWGWCEEFGESHISNYSSNVGTGEPGSDWMSGLGQHSEHLTDLLSLLFKDKPQTFVRPDVEGRAEGLVAGLSEVVYALTTYSAHLELSASESLPTTQPDSELHAMFPDAQLLGHALNWTIDNIGRMTPFLDTNTTYAPLCGGRTDDTWWSMENVDGGSQGEECWIDSIPVVNNRVDMSLRGNIYIENSAGESGDSRDVEPAAWLKSYPGWQPDYFKNMQGGSNSMSLLEIYGDMLYPLAIVHTAGMLKEFRIEADFFSDAGDDAFYSRYLKLAYLKNLITGRAVDSVAPDAQATRAETLQVAYRVADESVEHLSGNELFVDLTEQDWFQELAEDAAIKGFIEGVPCRWDPFALMYVYDSSSSLRCFFGNQPVTRAESLKLLANLLRAQLATSDSGPQLFEDVVGGEWFYRYVKWALDTEVGSGPYPYEVPALTKVAEGYKDGSFKPLRNITRGELAKVAANALLAARGQAERASVPGAFSVAKNASGGGVRIGALFEQEVDQSGTNLNAPSPVRVIGGNDQLVSAPILLTADRDVLVDGDGDELFYYWTASGGSFDAMEDVQFSSVLWSPPEVDQDTVFTVQVIRGDGRGREGAGILQLTVLGSTDDPAVGQITSPSGSQNGLVTVGANVSDLDGLKEVFVTFVNDGLRLALCGQNGPTLCAGTSGSYAAAAVDPGQYGAVPGPVELTLVVVDSEDRSSQVDTHEFTYSPMVGNGDYSLTIVKEGDGDGRVSGGGINCPPGCTGTTVTLDEGTAVTLTGSGDQFVGFTGETCYGTAPCSFGMYRDRIIHAAFAFPESLQVLYSSPANGDTGVATSSQPRIHFNREVFEGPALDSVSLSLADGTPVSFTPVVRSSDRYLTLVTASSLQQGQTYMVTLPAGAVVDVYGSPLAVPFGFIFTTEAQDAPKMYLSAYPLQILEGGETHVSIWFERPVDFDRTISLTSGPNNQLLHPSEVVLPAGQVMVELDVDSRYDHGDLAGYVETLQAREAQDDIQQSIQITVANYTSQTGSHLKWGASSVVNDDDGDGVFEAGEGAEVVFEVLNQGNSDVFNITLSFEVVTGTSNLRILGGKPYTCNIGRLSPGEGGDCSKYILANDELPTGSYFIEVHGFSSQNEIVDQARIEVVNNSQPDFAVSIGTVTSGEVQPGTVIKPTFTASNLGKGFSLKLPLLEVFIEVDGQERLLYRTYANARGDIYSSQSFKLPITAPDVPGEHPIRARINPSGDPWVSQIPESNTANNDAPAKTLRVASPNRAPEFDPLPDVFTVDVGELLSFTASAADADGDSLVYNLLPGSPAGMIIDPGTGEVTWTPICGQEWQSYPVAVRVEDPDGAADQESVVIDVGVRADLQVVKTASAPSALPGEMVSFVIQVTNLGPGCVAGATVRDTFEPELSDTTWSCSVASGSFCTSSGSGDILDSSVVLPSGGTVTYEVTARVLEGASGLVVNEARIEPPANVLDPVSSNDSDTASISLRDLDFGDAGDGSVDAAWAYPTRLVDDGARHGLGSGLRLGAVIDSEGDGQPSSSASGDDTVGADDEDGVVFGAALVACELAEVEVTASAPGVLNAWIDFGRDGSWSEAGDTVLADQALPAGTTTLSLSVPCEAAAGESFARFRLSSTGGLGASGLASDGEVEDHLVFIEQVPRTLTVITTGSGSGTVTSVPAGINCGLDCSEDYAAGTEVTLTANSDVGSAFVSWNGAGCSTGTCTVTMDGAQLVYADFEVVEPCYALTLASMGSGEPLVASPSSSVGCSPERYHAGELIELTAGPAVGWIVGGWNGTDDDGITDTQNLLTMPALDHAASVIYVESGVPAVLLVDDDNDDPDVRSFYTDTLDALGVSFDIWNTGNSDDEPDRAMLSLYRKVVWFTGAAFRDAVGPGAEAEGDLAAYLDAGGCLFLSGQDYLLDRGQTAFMTTYLGLGASTDDAKHDSVSGQGTVFDGLGPFALSFPTAGTLENFSDLVVPDALAEVAFLGDGGEAGLDKVAAGYRTVFLAFPFEALSALARHQVLRTALNLCEVDCAGPFWLRLEDESVIDVQIRESCDRIVTGQGFRVSPDGDLTLRAPGSVEFGDGFVVEQGGRLRVIIEKP